MFECVEAGPDDVAVLDPGLQSVLGGDRNILQRRNALALAGKVQVDLAARRAGKGEATAGKELIEVVVIGMLPLPRLDEHDMAATDPDEIAGDFAARSGQPHHVPGSDLIDLDLAALQ